MIKNVAILGAGALGLLYYQALEENTDVNCFFLAEGRRQRALNGKIFKVNREGLQVQSRNPHQEGIQADLIILAVKNNHIEEALPLAKAASGPQTILFSVLNGISSEILLEENSPESTVLYAAALGMDAVKTGDSLDFTRKGKILIGCKGNLKTAELQKVCDLLKKAKLEYTVPEDIHRELWYKWMINIGVNQTSAITGAPYGQFQKDRDLQELMNRAMHETIAVARASDVNLSEADLEQWYAVLETLGAEGKTSMLQDMEAQRPGEVDSFAGELIRRAALLGIDVPVNQSFYTIIKTKEKLFS